MDIQVTDKEVTTCGVEQARVWSKSIAGNFWETEAQAQPAPETAHTSAIFLVSVSNITASKAPLLPHAQSVSKAHLTLHSLGTLSPWPWPAQVRLFLPFSLPGNLLPGPLHRPCPTLCSGPPVKAPSPAAQRPAKETLGLP